MLSGLIGLLISLLALGLVLWLFWWFINQIPAPAPINTIIRVVFALIVLIAVLSLLFGGWSFPFAGHYYH
jgi:hypothetical protein